MTQIFPQKASVPNPSLDPFNVLIGSWNTTGTHGDVPNAVLHGHASFEWLEGGAFLMMRSELMILAFPAPLLFLVVTIRKRNITCSPIPSLFSSAASGGGVGGRGGKPGKDKDLAGKLHKAWEEANSQAWERRGGV